MDYFSLEVDPKEEASAIFVSKVQKAIISVAMKKKINQAQLAKKLGVNRSVVHRMLSEKSNITLRTLGEICWALNVEPSFQIYDIDEAVNTEKDTINVKSSFNENSFEPIGFVKIQAYLKYYKEAIKWASLHESKKVEISISHQSFKRDTKKRSDILKELLAIPSATKNRVSDKRQVENV